ncbi:hypothetical protein BDZ91DRAFT_807050 [Kalaharituber pfeilii]|nr:hypothetical protein BDZ91DRAFT_807050 [Kalaharituber pfeilii]
MYDDAYDSEIWIALMACLGYEFTNTKLEVVELEASEGTLREYEEQKKNVQVQAEENTNIDQQKEGRGEDEKAKRKQIVIDGNESAKETKARDVMQTVKEGGEEHHAMHKRVNASVEGVQVKKEGVHESRQVSVKPAEDTEEDLVSSELMGDRSLIVGHVVEEARESFEDEGEDEWRKGLPNQEVASLSAPMELGMEFDTMEEILEQEAIDEDFDEETMCLVKGKLERMELVNFVTEEAIRIAMLGLLGCACYVLTDMELYLELKQEKRNSFKSVSAIKKETLSQRPTGMRPSNVTNSFKHAGGLHGGDLYLRKHRQTSAATESFMEKISVSSRKIGDELARGVKIICNSGRVFSKGFMSVEDDDEDVPEVPEDESDGVKLADPEDVEFLRSLANLPEEDDDDNYDALERRDYIERRGIVDKLVKILLKKISEASLAKKNTPPFGGCAAAAAPAAAPAASFLLFALVSPLVSSSFFAAVPKMSDFETATWYRDFP